MESRRWQKIADELGNRTAKQVKKKPEVTRCNQLEEEREHEHSVSRPVLSYITSSLTPADFPHVQLHLNTHYINGMFVLKDRCVIGWLQKKANASGVILA